MSEPLDIRGEIHWSGMEPAEAKVQRLEARLREVEAVLDEEPYVAPDESGGVALAPAGRIRALRSMLVIAMNRQRERAEKAEAERDAAYHDAGTAEARASAIFEDERKWWDSERAKLEARAAELEAALLRATWIAQHLFQMTDQETWRASGEFVNGIYEGDIRAVETREELIALTRIAEKGSL